MEKLEKLKELLKLADSGLTREEFTNNFKIIIDLIKALKVSNQKELISLDSKYATVVNAIKHNADSDSKYIRQELMDYCMGEMKKMYKNHEEMKSYMEDKMYEIHALCQPDNELIAKTASNLAITACLDKIPTIDDINENIGSQGDLIAESLKDKLTIEMISGLKKELEDLRNVRGQRLGGGFSLSAMTQYMIYGETPLDSGDHLTFTLSHTPISGTLTLYRSRARQNLTEDYSISGKTITLTVAFDSANESLVADYIRG